MMVIDGGFSRAYHSETGIAGYTLVYHSRGFQLVQHEPFTSMQKAIEEGQDIKSSTQIVELSSQRMMVKDTDKGRELVTQINDLKKLLLAYRMGLIKEKSLVRTIKRKRKVCQNSLFIEMRVSTHPPTNFNLIHLKNKK